MDRVDLKIGFGCNNQCAFCVQGDKRSRYKPKTMDEVEKCLRDGLKRGAKGVVFTGGEPTIQPNFMESVRLARDLGYSDIQIQTNGRKLCYPEFAKEVVEAGATEFSPALHGSTAALHEFLTGAPGAFVQTMAAIRNLKKLGMYVATNSVLTKANYRDLPDLARLLVALGVDQYQFAFMHITGSAEKNKRWLVVRKSLAEPWVKRGLDVGLAAGKRVMTEAIPFCMMRGYEPYVAERIIPETVVYDADVLVESYTEFRRTQGKAKGPRCRECAYFKECEGPWKEYPDMFGFDEFVPVKEKAEPVS